MAQDVTSVALTVQDLLSRGLVHQAVQLGILAGYGGHVTVGAFSGGVTGGGNGTVIDQNQPEVVLSIGGNQCLIPVRFSVQAEIPVLTTDNDEIEILIAVDRSTGAAALSGNMSVQEEVFNMRTDLGASETGPVQAWSAGTADITNPTLGIELTRVIKVLDLATSVDQHYDVLEVTYAPKHPPLLVGSPDGLAVYTYWGGNVAVIGYAQFDFVTFPAGWVTNISG